MSVADKAAHVRAARAAGDTGGTQPAGHAAMTCRLKPGSLTAEGVVVGLQPVRNPWAEPVVVPADFGTSLRHTLGRCRALERAGWVMCPPALMPRILEHNEACLIHRDSPAYVLWTKTPIERRRAGAARP